MDTQTVLLVHVAVSFIALPLGLVAVGAYFSPTPAYWTRWFLAGAIATVVTGFLFPITSLTPATAVGIVASLVLLAMAAIHYGLGARGIWKQIYAIGMVINAYFLAFVLIAQSFLKVPPLKAIAPTGTELPFVIAQVILLAAFVWLGLRTWRQAGKSTI
ncbi:MAG: hypothetical protein LCH46_10665 [Proteobacteria bacterium]|nr:hypothetical protein [Pseudomonadota bacterium]